MELDPKFKNIYGKSDCDDLSISNELHKARGFRKLHIEKAVFGSSLQILHAVFFPQPNFDLPIFGVDLVANSLGISPEKVAEGALVVAGVMPDDQFTAIN